MSRTRRHLDQEGDDELARDGRAKRVSHSNANRNFAKRTSLNMAKQTRIEDRASHVAEQIAKGNLTRERSCDGVLTVTAYQLRRIRDERVFDRTEIQRPDPAAHQGA